jgi:molybdate transport system ATP-binding protein
MSSSPLVRLSRVDVALAGTPVLHAIDWELARGEHWGIVGANGSGKTSFLNLVAGTLWPAPDSGVRTYDFGDGGQRDAVEARQRIVLVGHELQDRYARWNWNFSALDVVLSGVYRTDVPRRRPLAAERAQALQIMRQLAIAYLAQRPFLQLSRGEQRRVLIARGFAFQPLVLLLDEPASGLDRGARAELREMLEQIGASTTLVCSAHVQSDLPPSIARILHLDHGRIVRDRPNAHAGQLPPTQPDAQHRFAAADAPLVAIENAHVWLGTRHVLQDITWRLLEHEHWLVTGANGAGKSSFLRLVHGQLRPAVGGEIRWPALGDPRNVWTLRKRIAWVAAELQAGYRYPTTVRECVASGFESSIGLTRQPNDEECARVEEVLAQLELTEIAQRKLATLSYGQVRRALVARALVSRPRILLLDEPWEGLDQRNAALFNDHLRSVMAAGTQLVCSSHLDAHRKLFTHELVLERGAIASSGKSGSGTVPDPVPDPSATRR